MQADDVQEEDEVWIWAVAESLKLHQVATMKPTISETNQDSKQIHDQKT